MTRSACAGVGACAAVAIVLAARAAGADGGGFWQRVAQDVHARVSEAIAARAPKLVPPVPIAVAWKPQRIGSIDLGAPLVALVGAELGGDGKGELYAVTPREVIAIGERDHRPVVLGRVAFAGEPAVPAPRDVVGAAVVEGGVVIASASRWAKELRVSWRGGQLVGEPGDFGIAWCAGERAQLEPGRNFSGAGAAASYGARCRGDLVDGEGYPLHVRGELATTGRLDVTIERCAAGGASCVPAARYGYAEVGVAFAFADVDHDGTPEVVYAAAGAPGDPDTVRVVALGDDAKQAKLKKTFPAGGVAGIAELDGHVVAAVRLVGATRVDLWRLD